MFNIRKSRSVTDECIIVQLGRQQFGCDQLRRGITGNVDRNQLMERY